MGYTKYLKQLWKKPKESFGTERWRSWLMQLRKEPILIRVDNPTRLDRARALGYKAKQGYLIVRSRVRKGARKRPRPGHGRRQAHYGRFFTTGSSLQAQAEQHIRKKYPNCEVLNSYWVGEDGRYKWFEVILVDRDHPVIKADKKINFISNQRGRASRGLTSAGKKHRGLKK
ncbi:MAG: 50S ribosomal protein L15e [DPANN group archaeon]|nr:50S ribosomal protein L15e [DPANN group archaeon]